MTEDFTITCNGTDHKFTGTILASVSDARSLSDSMLCDYAMTLYQVEGGAYFCFVSSGTTSPGALPDTRGMYCDSVSGVVKFCGDGDLAQKLYAAAGIGDVEMRESAI